ncbi:MAG: hypothetical protein AAF799_21620 [Myxococcota bacterium]
MVYRSLGLGLMMPLWLGACSAINPAYEDTEVEATATAPATTDEPSPTSSATTAPAPDDDGVVTSGTGMATTDVDLDTGGEEGGSSGDVLDCDQAERPIDISIYSWNGDPVNPDNVCGALFPWFGRVVAVDHGLELVYCPDCKACSVEVDYIVDFGTSLNLPAGFTACGDIEFWPGTDLNGDCRWQGLAIFDGEFGPDPVFVGSNTSQVPPWPDNDIKIAAVEGCELDPPMCGSQPTGVQDVVVNNDYVVPAGVTAEFPMGSGSNFAFTNRMSNVDDQCRTRISWMAHQ